MGPQRRIAIGTYTYKDAESVCIWIVRVQDLGKAESNLADPYASVYWHSMTGQIKTGCPDDRMVAAGFAPTHRKPVSGPGLERRKIQRISNVRGCLPGGPAPES